MCRHIRRRHRNEVSTQEDSTIVSVCSFVKQSTRAPRSFVQFLAAGVSPLPHLSIIMRTPDWLMSQSANILLINRRNWLLQLHFCRLLVFLSPSLPSIAFLQAAPIWFVVFAGRIGNTVAGAAARWFHFCLQRSRQRFSLFLSKSFSQFFYLDFVMALLQQFAVSLLSLLLSLLCSPNFPEREGRKGEINKKLKFQTRNRK